MLSSRKLKVAALFAVLLLTLSAAFYLYSGGSKYIPFPPGLAASPSHSGTAANKDDHTPLSAAIVAAVQKDTDLGWLSEVNNRCLLLLPPSHVNTHSMWKLHRYNFDDPNPPPSAWFPANKGHEAMMYLSYIITNYNSLPNYSLFIHGHRQSWHQEGDMVDLINSLQIQALERDGYVPLRCDWYPSCPAEIRPLDHDATVWGPGVHREDAEREIGKSWKELFGSIELPRTIASQCCAQFAVTRDTIHRRSRADYERMREWLLRSELIDDISGRVFEKLWAYIMTGDAVRCPPPQQCACQYFGRCTPREWPIPPEGLAKWE
ncbi:hypothetical protein BU26DRAFT_516639 [Trematosphaeria pertusa]|uniref:DUF3431 domain-containing protein n=1 Tax=Trematosphaeria pertusa TaxID=390896 RepID=A0A6A6IQ74_9PLEO|nr:uncharacterized protein BU26DRAFT_516639 [Trematosphaeria pertusa]KAF2251912.1 hypothetical protein BU26DRAFT_516639 [Trematosphaeria pertusa]